MGAAAVPPLRDALTSDETVVRREALRSLGKLRERASIDPQIVIPALLDALDDPEPSVRDVAVTYLGIVRDDPGEGGSRADRGAARHRGRGAAGGGDCPGCVRRAGRARDSRAEEGGGRIPTTTSSAKPAARWFRSPRGKKSRKRAKPKAEMRRPISVPILDPGPSDLLPAEVRERLDREVRDPVHGRGGNR